MPETSKILLVDDEPGMLRYIKTLLEVDSLSIKETYQPYSGVLFCPPKWESYDV